MNNVEKDKKINVIISKFLSELAAIEQNAVSLVTVTLTINPEYFPKTGYRQQLEVDGNIKTIHEQQGSKPMPYYVTCYEQ
ncbi:hypothetical protein SAMN05444266_101707 [Chitinophaga jiangningensis]|uniref:Uncharacterized protein n=1 Tax=Chitinophaga jiangningensis TaxID=1419482 RepID=A0A1M6WNR8_9BACT|nr:hypothetical protein [Chitinophaga jiangningensis]SHK95387.1 hypothetical protein SAMN05444266_101707 [Chitinophaga jiangningensis]